ncbi:MAG: histidine triad nucleotide-binding protein [Pseudomonadota bacterium]
MSNCLFCKIISGEISGEVVYQDEMAVAFRDINPQAPVHLLIVPREHISSLAVAKEDHKEILGHLMMVAAKLADQEGIRERGFRTVINTNVEAGQTVFHIHVHVLGGRFLGWPPG